MSINDNAELPQINIDKSVGSFALGDCGKDVINHHNLLWFIVPAGLVTTVASGTKTN